MLPSINQQLPSSYELPCSDDTPVDNEDQNLLPNLLLMLLSELWSERQDWYFGVDMAIYHTTGASPFVPIVPDGFLSVGVDRQKDGDSRRSYVMWEEQEIPPMFVLEMVSHTPGGEYDKKMEIYAKLGVRYYLIYNPKFWQRDRHQPFELYALEDGAYRLQTGELFWMPEVELGVGRYWTDVNGVDREILTWYDAAENRHPSKAEREFLRAEREQQRADREQQRAEEERQRAEEERQRADRERQVKERLAEFLRSQGFDPDELPE
ncbi:MAG: Uma2 family endonuclease [Geitlerinemataceae cyanobacterium]